MMTPAMAAGSLGVALLLVAFVLNLFRVMSSEGAPYLLLNFLGAALACYSSYMIRFPPFVLLEFIWATAALVSLVRLYRQRGRSLAGNR